MSKPPYTLTPRILELMMRIGEKVGTIRTTHLEKPRAELRKVNRIKTIQSSLEIEGNTLTEAQVTAIIENKRVAGPAKDILEVKNAIGVYGIMDRLHPFRLRSLLEAHRKLMNGLIPNAGRFRTGQVGIARGKALTHLAPPPSRVPELMKDLLNYLSGNEDPILIRSCVFHYEFEFIHPFADGNGRMGRLWQTLILSRYHPIFGYLPVEAIIKERQKEYYEALRSSDRQATSTPFIEFMLEAIEEVLTRHALNPVKRLTTTDRLVIFQKAVGKKTFSRKDYLVHFNNLSTATASRDLRSGVDSAILIITGEKRMAVYRYTGKFKKLELGG